MKLGNITNSARRDLISLSPLMSEWKTNSTIPEIYLRTGWDSYKGKEYVVFDTETNGFADEIIEIGAIIVKDDLIKHKDGSFHPYEYYTGNNKQYFNDMDSFAYFVLPVSGEVPEKITEITNITYEQIVAGLADDAPEGTQTYDNFVDAFTDFAQYINGRPIVAHNAGFDTGIFKWSANKFYADLDTAIKNPNHPLTLDLVRQFFSLEVIDTYGAATRAFALNPNISHKNGVLSTFFGLEPNETMLHRAIYDVIFTARNFYGIYEHVGNTYENMKSF